MHRPFARFLLVLSAAAALPQAASAEFRLVETVQKDGGARFVLRFQAEKMPAVDAAKPVWPEEFSDGLADPAWKPLAGSSTTLCLLAVPAGSRWTMTAKGAPAGSFSMRDVRVGPYSAVQIVAYSEKFVAGEYTVEVTGASVDLAGRHATEPLVDGVFLNSIPKGTKVLQKGSLPPAAAAPWKIVYTEGERIIRFAIPEGIDAAELRITHHGRVLAWEPVGEAEGVLYLPERTDIGTDQHDAVFLSGGGEPSPVIQSAPAFSSLDPALQESAVGRTRLYRPRLVYERSTPLSIGDRFVQYRLSRTQTRVTEYAFPDRLADGTVAVGVSVLGLNTLTEVEPDHYANFSLGGVSAGATRSWDGRISFADSFAVALDPASYPGGSAQTIAFSHNIPAIVDGPAADLQNLDSVSISYIGFPRVDADQRLLLSVGESDGSRLLTIGGFSVDTTAEDLLLLDVTDDASPVRLESFVLFADASGTIAVEWEAPAGAGDYLVEKVINVSSIQSPVATGSFAEATTETLRGIFVCPAPLQESLQPLLQLRGPGYIVLDPEAAYDAYSHGQESPEAIRSALRNMISSAHESVAFPAVTLIGHATFDRRNYLGLITSPQVPTFIDESIDTSFTIENCVDMPYALLFGDDDLVDVRLGRLPAMDAAELALMVERIVAHDAAAEELSALKRPAVFSYDNDQSILADKPVWAELWETTRRPLHEVVIQAGSNGVAENTQLRGHLEEAPSGASFVMYTGHGNNTIWASVGLLRADEIAEIQTRAGYPFVTTFTCLNSYYAFPGAAVRSMSERWLLAPVDRGGIASYAPCSVDYYGAQRVKANLFLELLSSLDRPATVGDLTTQARIAFAIERPDLAHTNREYLLFGDPDSPTTIPPLDRTSFMNWQMY